MTVAHWDEVEPHRRAKGEMDATWQALGNAAGTRGVGVNRVRVAPGKLPTPPHSHGASEELYFVLSGSGLAWQNGEVHEVRPLDCIIQRPRETEHTFVAGPDGLEYLVFGTRHPTELGWLPRSGAIRLGRQWVEGRNDDPWDVEATVEPLAVGEPAPRPANIVNVDEVELEPDQDPNHMTTASLATRERSMLAGLHWEKLGSSRRGSVPHCHSAEEEVFVILDGTATLELWRSPRSESDAVEEIPLLAGHVVARPPGTRVSHSFRAGPEGVTMLIYGTRDVNDICFYPRSKKISWRGVGVIGRIEMLDYFDGEPLEDD
ncbi:MAG TPA: cupin domain-containing protein [Gaiellaceae bacterium]|nr:cupin domain-containing protein [Gaiellaceae bacterium]